MCKIFADCSGFCTFFRNVCTLFQMKISSAPDGPMEKKKHKRGRFGPFHANTPFPLRPCAPLLRQWRPFSSDTRITGTSWPTCWSPEAIPATAGQSPLTPMEWRSDASPRPRRKEGSTLTVLRHSRERIVRSKGDTPPLPSTHSAGSIRDDARGGGMDSGGIGSRRENRSLSHDPYTFECQCQSRELDHTSSPLYWNEWKSLSESIHKKFSTFLQKRGEGFLKECAKKWAFCAEIKW